MKLLLSEFMGITLRHETEIINNAYASGIYERLFSDDLE